MSQPTQHHPQPPSTHQHHPPPPPTHQHPPLPPPTHHHHSPPTHHHHPSPPHEYDTFPGIDKYPPPPPPVIVFHDQPVPPPGASGGPSIKPYVHGHQAVPVLGYAVAEGKPMATREHQLCSCIWFLIFIGLFFATLLFIIFHVVEMSTRNWDVWRA